MKSKVLIIGLVWPEPDTTAAGSRMMQLIHFFLEQDREVHFASTASKTRHSFPLEGIHVHLHSIQLNDASFDSWIASLNPDVVVFDRFVTEEQFSWRVREHCATALRMLDSEDLHFLREARRQALSKKRKEYAGFLLNDIALRELASIYRSDLTLVISEVEYALLNEHFHIDEKLLCYLPFWLEPDQMEDTASLAGFLDRRDFMTIGNWKHGPNKDAVLFLKEEIWPVIIKRIPGARMHVYGAYGEDQEQTLHDEDSGFLIRGWAHSKREAFCRHRLCLAPLRYGAGLKGKLLDAMRFGTPSVTTSIGAEGMHGGMPWAGQISDDPEDFVSRAVELYRNEKLWQEAQVKGHQIIEARFIKNNFARPLRTRMDELEAGLEDHRSVNFVGALLWHHTAQSTRYLSKWIEAKNKNLAEGH